MIQKPDSDSRLYLELPPALAHYFERGRNVWLQSAPSAGRLSFLNRAGVFVDLEAMAVQRRQMLTNLGRSRARALSFKTGYEQGRRDASRHYTIFEKNVKLALQAGPVFMQLRGLFLARESILQVDLEHRMLQREISARNSAEALAHMMVTQSIDDCVCWNACGYLSGHASEILGRRVLALETSCIARKDDACKFVCRFDSEWGDEVQWIHDALSSKSFEDELEDLTMRLSTAERVAKRAQSALDRIEQTKRPVMLQLDDLIADSAVMQTVIRRARQVSVSDLPVLLEGPPSTGKMTLARALHQAGTRKAGPFEVADCTGISGEALNRQIFGFVKGAFSGATRSFAGLAVRAHSGTLYINEISALDKEGQGLLLRIIQDAEVLPQGADDPVKTNVRVIAATQEDLRSLLDSKRIREDLYYTLSVGRIEIPALCERGPDLLRFLETLLWEFRERYGRREAVFSEEAMHAILDYSWPNNIEQLSHAIEHAFVFGHETILGLEDLPEEVLAGRFKKPQKELSEEVIRAALRRARGNKTKAADLLGVGRTTLWRGMKRYNIE